MWFKPITLPDVLDASHDEIYSYVTRIKMHDLGSYILFKYVFWYFECFIWCKMGR
jgi:hypothetical protein